MCMIYIYIMQIYWCEIISLFIYIYIYIHIHICKTKSDRYIYIYKYILCVIIYIKIKYNKYILSIWNMYIFTMLSISNAFLFATAANQDIDTFAAFESCKGSYSCHLMPTLMWKPCSSHVIAHLISSHGWPWSDGLICLLHAILNGGTDGHNHVMTATHDALPLIEGSAIVLMRLHLIDLVDDARAMPSCLSCMAFPKNMQ